MKEMEKCCYTQALIHTTFSEWEERSTAPPAANDRKVDLWYDDCRPFCFTDPELSIKPYFKRCFQISYIYTLVVSSLHRKSSFSHAREILGKLTAIHKYKLWGQTKEAKFHVSIAASIFSTRNCKIRNLMTISSWQRRFYFQLV